MTTALNQCFVLVLLHCSLVLARMECGRGVTTSGYTYPQGDITLNSGDNLTITCVLNEAAASKYGPNASQYMRYVLGNRTFPVEIVNSTSIRLHIENHPRTSLSDYFCMVNDSLVCHNIVAVGNPPQDVTDFDCIGQNYENFTCSWTPPRNFIATYYELAYKPTSRPSFLNCPHNLTKQNDGKLACTWGLGTKPQYRHSHDSFTFKLNAQNTFGTKVWQFEVQQYTKVRPNPPENLKGVSTSPHSIKLNWTVPLYMQSFHPGLEYRVSWFIEHCKKWTTVKFSKPLSSTVEYELTDLPYAHCLYDIRVSIKSLPATEERMWSQNASITIWTLPKIPDCPPNTTSGIFQVLDGIRSRRIYWQNIHNYQENGENLIYHVEVEGQNDIEPFKVHHNYAEFKNMPNKNLTIKIWSKNNVGKSTNASTVFLPSQEFTLKRLSKLVKVDKGDGVYDLEWTESSDPRVTNYTLFWCSAQKERPYPCDGVLQWEILPRSVTNKTLKLPTYNYEKNQTINIYQFAISANAAETTSGMLWADCTIIPGNGVKLSQTYVKEVGSRYITLQWKLECMKLGDIQSFNVSYCMLSTPSSQECQPNTKKYKLFDNQHNKFGFGEGELNVTDLKPYTGYIFQVRPIVNGAESQFGEPMFNATTEETPTEPRNLKAYNITDRALTIQWEKPLEENGRLSNYFVVANEIEIPVQAEKEKLMYSRRVEGLLPRTNYTVIIKACSSGPGCSNSSISVSTDIGNPGTIAKPSANWDNDTLVVKWDKPDAPGVKVDFYEIGMVTLKRKDELQLANTTKSFYQVKYCDINKSQRVYLQVRGVNIRGNQKLYGNWSETADFPCIRNEPPTAWLIFVGIMGGLLFVGLLSYLTKKMWCKVTGMRNFPAKLPTGLDTVVSTSESKRKNPDETLPGEPLLPEKLSPPSQNVNGDSSGCCSGTESVSSSADSAGHLSISDSGTDHPRSPSLGESEHRDISLRQRPSVKKIDYLSTTNEPPQTSYSIIGLGIPTQKSEVEPDFLPLADMKLPPCLQYPIVAQAQETTKTSGYVPIFPHESAAKNTPYVLAGAPIPAAKLPQLKMPIFTQSDDDNPDDEPSATTFPWQQQQQQQQQQQKKTPSRYVVVGDSKPQKADLGNQKGSKTYLSLNKHETSKSIKED
ncbi:hypothetical protein ABEB36_011464 [Hypothenemus hampei]|uniref:Fibronectin type-III domain-containing protein n=1 Tax=Hypothenemus hampei TaxID=57062 RepID=A0ABD1EFI2_HYPHA